MASRNGQTNLQNAYQAISCKFPRATGGAVVLHGQRRVQSVDNIVQNIPVDNLDVLRGLFVQLHGHRERLLPERDVVHRDPLHAHLRLVLALHVRRWRAGEPAEQQQLLEDLRHHLVVVLGDGFFLYELHGVQNAIVERG